MGINEETLEYSVLWSKQICRDLGFKTNTEKFADCALKMMSIQFEATNKVSNSSGGTTQEIIVKHKQGYFLDWEKDQVSQLINRLNIYKITSKQIKYFVSDKFKNDENTIRCLKIFIDCAFST